jgi:hypothetical protein
LDKTLRTRSFGWMRNLSFATGIATLFLALLSPFDALDDQLLSAHMVQHLVLLMVAPPDSSDSVTRRGQSLQIGREFLSKRFRMVALALRREIRNLHQALQGLLIRCASLFAIAAAAAAFACCNNACCCR